MRVLKNFPNTKIDLNFLNCIASASLEMQLLHMKYLGALGVTSALMLAGCGGGSSHNSNSGGPFTVDGTIDSSDFFDQTDNRNYDIFVTEVASSGTAEVDMTSNDLDSELFIYRRDSSGDYNLIAQDDDSGDGPDAAVSFKVKRGEVYRVITTSSREQEFGNYRVYFSRELGRPAVVLPRINGTATAGAELPRIKVKGALEQRTKQ